MKKIYLLLLVVFSFIQSNAQQNCLITTTYDSLTSTYTFVSTSNGPNTLFEWNFGDGNTGLGNPVSHQFVNPGAYAVCTTERDTFTQNVISSCCLSITTSGAGLPCAFSTYTANQVDFIFTATPPFSSVISWDFGDGSTGGGSQASHTYSTSGVFYVCMTTISALDTCVTCQTITVNTTPQPCTISSSVDSANYFLQYFYFNPINPTNQLNWTFGDGSTATGGTTVSHVYPSNGLYSACVVETDSTGTMVCQACIGISVGPTTSCSFAFTPDPANMNTLNFISNYDTTLYVAVWNFGDGVSYTGGPFEQHTFAAPGPYFVCMDLIDITTQALMCSYCAPVAIPGGPQPCAANFTTVPFGLDAYFIDYSSADPTVTTYVWDFGDGSPLNTARFPVHTYSTPGTYNVCLAIQNSACVDTMCQTIVVDSTIIAPMFCTSYFIFTQLSPYQLAVVNLSSGVNLSFNWDFGDGSTSTAAYPIHNYPNTGTYQICLTVSDATGCTNTYCDSLTVDSTGMITYRSTNVGFTINVVSPTQLNTVSVEETPSLISNIFPNPSKDRIVVTSTATSGVAIYSILSVSNQKMKEGRLSGEKSEIDISDLASGIYFLEVKNKAGEKSFGRFIKE